MSRPRDLQIFWVVLLAGCFWVVIWQHEQAAKLWHTVSTAAIAMTSNFRSAPPPAAPDAAETGKSAKDAAKTGKVKP